MSKSVGDKVEWDWGNGTGEGRVSQRHEQKTTRKINGSEITRNGTKENPTLYIEQDDGGAVLKLASEVRMA